MTAHFVPITIDQCQTNYLHYHDYWLTTVISLPAANYTLEAPIWEVYWKPNLIDGVDSCDLHRIGSESFIRVFGYIGTIIRDIGVIREVWGSHNDFPKRRQWVTNGDSWQWTRAMIERNNHLQLPLCLLGEYHRGCQSRGHCSNCSELQQWILE